MPVQNASRLVPGATRAMEKVSAYCPGDTHGRISTTSLRTSAQVTLALPKVRLETRRKILPMDGRPGLFSADEILVGFALSDDAPLIPIHQNLCRPRAGIVVRRL